MKPKFIFPSYKLSWREEEDRTWQVKKNKACISVEESQEAAGRTSGRFGSWRLQPTAWDKLGRR